MEQLHERRKQVVRLHQKASISCRRGDGRVLSQVQEDPIQRMIIDKRPELLKMDFHLWSRAAVGQLVEQEFGINLQVRCIERYLTHWSPSSQRVMGYFPDRRVRYAA